MVVTRSTATMNLSPLLNRLFQPQNFDCIIHFLISYYNKLVQHYNSRQSIVDFPDSGAVFHPHIFRLRRPTATAVLRVSVVTPLQRIFRVSGLSFPDLYQKCREAFFVNSTLTLKAQLTEFRDHKLIKSRKVSVPSSESLVEIIKKISGKNIL